MLAGLYMVYVDRPRDHESGAGAEAAAGGDATCRSARSSTTLLTSFLPLAVLILSVLGAIMFGLATPSEAAAIGALGASCWPSPTAR